MKSLSCKYALFASGVLCLLIWQSCKKAESIKPQIADSSQNAIAKNNVSVLTTSAGDSLFQIILTHRTSTNPVPIKSAIKICSDPKGNLYVTCSFTNYVGISKVTPQGVVSQFGGPVNTAGIKAAKNGDIYIVGYNNNKYGIGRITPDGVIHYLTITGQQLKEPTDLALSDDGTIYITDIGLHQVLKVTPQGVCSALAGSATAIGSADGTGQQAHFTNPTSIRLSADGLLWVIDGNEKSLTGQTIRKVTLTGSVSTKYILNYVGTRDDYIRNIAIAKRDKNFNLSPYESIFILHRSNKITHWGTNGVETPLNIYSKNANPYEEYSISLFTDVTSFCIHENAIYIPESYNYYNFVVRKITKYK